jgi:phage repressor protein C with HTH and peptisase S24 domain
MGEHLPEGIVHLGDESWFTCKAAERALANGQMVSFIGRGTSMEPVIPDGSRCVLMPDDGRSVPVGMPVFCTVRGHYALHMVYAVRLKGRWLLIGPTHGQWMDGWTPRSKVHGLYVGRIK